MEYTSIPINAVMANSLAQCSTKKQHSRAPRDPLSTGSRLAPQCPPNSLRAMAWLDAEHAVAGFVQVQLGVS